MQIRGTAQGSGKPASSTSKGALGMTNEVARMIGTADLLRMARELAKKGLHQQADQLMALALAVQQDRCF